MLADNMERYSDIVIFSICATSWSRFIGFLILFCFFFVAFVNMDFRTHWVISCMSTHGLVAMTSAQHAEGRQFEPGWVY